MRTEARIQRPWRTPGAYRGPTVALLAVLLFGACEGSPTGEVFSVEGLPAYAHARDSLQTLVDEEGEQPTNRFCVVGLVDEDGNRTVWVHWQEANALILWEPYTADAGEEQRQDLVRSRRQLDLARDVVAAGDDVQGSTYRVTRAWVDQTLDACGRAGSRFVVEQTER